MPAAWNAWTIVRNSSTASPRVRLVGREEVERHVTPVVALLRIELVDRHQLDDLDAEFLEVGNLFGQSPAKVPRFAGVTPEFARAVNPLTCNS